MASEDGSNHAADHHTGKDSGRLDQIFSTYLDRLNAGEQLDPLEIIANHPEEGEELLADLEAFLRLRPVTHERQAAPLGTIGDYTLRRRIGRGGMGVVYEAWENSMDRPVALKVLSSALAADQRTFLRFCREARLAGKLHHPNIVGVFGMGIKGDTPHYAMELVKGETLAQIVTKWKNGPPDAAAPFAASREEIGFYSALAKAFAGVAEELLSLASECVRCMPHNPMMGGLRFGLLLATGRLDEARAEAERVMALHLQAGDEYHDLAHLAQGSILREEGSFEEAEKAIRRALEYMPDHTLYRRELARTLEAAGKLTDALSEYDWLTKRQPTWAVGWSGAAQVLNRLERYEEAEVLARKAIGLSPQNTSAYGTLAYALAKTERCEEAVRVAEEGLQAVPGRVEPYLGRGLAQEGLGDPAAAARSFCRALELHPEYVGVHEALAALVGQHENLRDLPEIRRLAESLEAKALASRKKALLERTISVLRGREPSALGDPQQSRE